jgi:alkaline phosphatase D
MRSSDAPDGTCCGEEDGPGRRAFLIKAGGLATASLLWCSAPLSPDGAGPAVAAAQAPRRRLPMPFRLGVASGDPQPDSVVIWTRLVAEPQAPAGGMPDHPVRVDWEVAADEAFSLPVRRGSLEAQPQSAHAVHVEVGRLEPARVYWYRFHAGGEASPVGRTRTAPAPGAAVERLRFAFASCQKYEVGFYTAYEHMAEEDLDLIVFLGDYIYERAFKATSIRGTGLAIGRGEAVTLEDYRMRYALYKSDPLLQAAHAAFPWIVAFDDHEVENDWGGDVPQSPRSRAAFLARRAAAFQAYWEHMPLRRSARPRGSDMSLFRRLTFGKLATFHVLDTRQFRSPSWPCGYAIGPLCPEVLDPARTMLGARQERWLLDGLEGSRARWNVLAQQVSMTRLDVGADEPQFKLDKWDAYPAARERLFRFLAERRPSNPVVITGDLHNSWVALLKADFGDPGSATLATEFIGTSISSGGNGAEQSEEGRIALRKNPHVLFHNDLRGYVRCEVSDERWVTDFRAVPYIKRPGAPISTRARFVLEDGDPVARAV